MLHVLRRVTVSVSRESRSDFRGSFLGSRTQTKKKQEKEKKKKERKKERNNGRNGKEKEINGGFIEFGAVAETVSRSNGFMTRDFSVCASESYFERFYNAPNGFAISDSNSTTMCL